MASEKRNTQLIETQEDIASRFCSETDGDVSLWETEDSRKVKFLENQNQSLFFWKGSELFSKWLPVNRDVCCAPLRRASLQIENVIIASHCRRKMIQK